MDGVFDPINIIDIFNEFPGRNPHFVHAVPGEQGGGQLTPELGLGNRNAEGKGLTVTEFEALFEQPLASVYVYVIICVPTPAVAGSKLLFVTPFPV